MDKTRNSIPLFHFLTDVCSRNYSNKHVAHEVQIYCLSLLEYDTLFYVPNNCLFHARVQWNRRVC